MSKDYADLLARLDGKLFQHDEQCEIVAGCCKCYKRLLREAAAAIRELQKNGPTGDFGWTDNDGNPVECSMREALQASDAAATAEANFADEQKIRAKKAEAELELVAAERSSAAEAATVLLTALNWKSGGLASAAIQIVAERAEAREDAARNREKAAEFDRINELRIACMRERDALRNELQNIANADPREWGDTADQFQAWAQNRARHTLAHFDAAMKEGK